jgi:three-Cys-motif partner protein
MATPGFHEKAFDEGTLTKLDLFELYTREWLPVFLAREDHTPPVLHLFDFFAGPGADAVGNLGSPLRTLRTIEEYSNAGFAGWDKAHIHCHFFDASIRKVKALKEAIAAS